METTRQKKVAKLLQKELSDIFQKEMKGLIPNVLLTITVVRMSPDLSLAKVYVGFLPNQNALMLLDNMKENTKQIRHALGVRIRHQVRIIPHLNFYIDDTEVEVLKMETLLKTLNIPPVGEDKVNEADYDDLSDVE